MKFIIPIIAILIFLVLVGIRVRKQRNLMKRGEDYDKLLREAKVTRYQYIQALQKTREHIIEVEKVEEKLTTMKAELIGYRNELRDRIVDMRKLQKKSTGSELDKRTLAQKNNDLVQLRAHNNARKKVCMDIEESFNELKDRLKQQENSEREVTNRWYTQKKEVLKTYKELKDQLALADPQRAFS